MPQPLDRLEKAHRLVLDAVQQFWSYHFDRQVRYAQESDQLLIAEMMRAHRKELEKLEEIDQAFQAGLKKGMKITRVRYAILLRAFLASIVAGTLVLAGLLWYNWDRLCTPPNNPSITTTNRGGKL